MSCDPLIGGRQSILIKGLGKCHITLVGVSETEWYGPSIQVNIQVTVQEEIVGISAPLA